MNLRRKKTLALKFTSSHVPSFIPIAVFSITASCRRWLCCSFLQFLKSIITNNMEASIRNTIHKCYFNMVNKYIQGFSLVTWGRRGILFSHFISTFPCNDDFLIKLDQQPQYCKILLYSFMKLIILMPRYEISTLYILSNHSYANI